MVARIAAVLGALALVMSLGVTALGAEDPAPEPAPDPRAAEATATPEATSSPTEQPLEVSRMPTPTLRWSTDFGITSIDLAEIQPSVPRDAIPTLDDPVFESIVAAQGWMDGRAPVIALEIEGDARAYPLSILLWHEIVNDEVGGRPLLITFCPLCHTALVYDRELDGVERRFGNTGKLRYSDMIMYDRATESWWQQATGEAIIGELTGARLDFVASQVLSLDDFAAAFPDGEVLSRDTGSDRDYGSNPFLGYDAADEQPFRYEGEIDGRLAPKERVVSVGGPETGAIAFSYSDLARTGVATEIWQDQPIVVFWTPGTASTFNGPTVGLGAEDGSVGVFSPVLDGRELTFEWVGPSGPITDTQTGSTWTVTGKAGRGELAGAQLEPVLHGNHFWFSWAAFTPDTRVWQPPTAD
ncbi:MAG: DUF3179 domain-containing protein [Chloroflexota bacterium]